MKPKHPASMISMRKALRLSTAPDALLHKYSDLPDDNLLDPVRAAELFDLAEQMSVAYAEDQRTALLFVWAGAEENWAACMGIIGPYDRWKVLVDVPIPANVEWDQTHVLLHRIEEMAGYRRNYPSRLPPQPTHAGKSSACH